MFGTILTIVRNPLLIMRTFRLHSIYRNEMKVLEEFENTDKFWLKRNTADENISPKFI